MIYCTKLILCVCVWVHSVPARATRHWFSDECQRICSLSYILLPACCCAINSSSSNGEIDKTLQENTRRKSGDDVWKAF